MKKQSILVLAASLFSLITMISTTLAEAPWKFIVTCDSRSYDSRWDDCGDRWGDANGVNTVIMSELRDEIIDKGVELVLFPGDLVQGYTNETTIKEQLENWLNIMDPVYDANIAVYPCRGNHDYYYDYPGAAWLSEFGSDGNPDHNLPSNGPPGEEYMTYSVTHKNAFFVGLDQYVNLHCVKQNWLNDQLAGNTKPHVFVFGHEPAFQATTKHHDCLDDCGCTNCPEPRDEFWESIKNAGGRVYFCGHDHFYNHAGVDDGDGQPCGDVHQCIIGTAGAPLRHLPPYYDGANGPYTPYSIHDANDYGYVLVEVDNYDVTLTWMERDTNDPCVLGTYMAKEEWRYTAQDSDCDGVPDISDNCPLIPNPDQNDIDEDGFGDVCDTCPNDYDPNQTDTDGDGLGDLCDGCPYDPDNDIDADGVCGDEDNCPLIPNGPNEGTCTSGDNIGQPCDSNDVCGTDGFCSMNQEDSDGDGFGDVCDGCPEVPNPPGDFDGDCYVNLKDFALITMYWLDTDCGVVNLWCERVDYDQNTDITLEEVLFVARNWLDCTDPDPPCSYQP